MVGTKRTHTDRSPADDSEEAIDDLDAEQDQRFTRIIFQSNVDQLRRLVAEIDEKNNALQEKSNDSTHAELLSTAFVPDPIVLYGL